MPNQVPGRTRGGRASSHGQEDDAGQPGLDSRWLNLAIAGFPSDLQGEIAARAASAAAALEEFLSLLLRWNLAINLSGARDLRTLVLDHLPDALALSCVAPEGGALLDVGSGGGLPALPLLLLRPDLTGTLVEPRAKRVAFLRTAIRELGVGGRASVLAGRLCSPAPPAMRGRFDLAVSRATFAPEAWASLGREVVARSGLVCRLLGGATRHQGPAHRQGEGQVPLASRHGVMIPYALANGARRELVVERVYDELLAD